MTEQPPIAKVADYEEVSDYAFESAVRDRMAGLVASARMMQHPVNAFYLEGLNVQDSSEVLGELEAALRTASKRHYRDVVVQNGQRMAVFMQGDSAYLRQWFTGLDSLLQNRCIVAAEACVTYAPGASGVPGKTYVEQAQALTRQLQQAFQKNRAFKKQQLAKQVNDFALLNLQAAFY